MQEDDPYRAPSARVETPALQLEDGEISCWRDGRALVVARHRPLPPRCVKCNADAVDGMRSRRFWWTPAWVHLPFLALPASGRWVGVVLLVWLLANIFFRRSTKLAYGLCKRHRRREILRWIALVPIWLIAVQLALHGGTKVVWSIALMLVLLVVAYGLQTLRVRRIDAACARFAGCGAAFLSSLPVLPAREIASSR